MPFGDVEMDDAASVSSAGTMIKAERRKAQLQAKLESQDEPPRYRFCKDKDELTLRSAVAAVKGSDGNLERAELVAQVREMMGSFVSATLAWGEVKVEQYMGVAVTGSRVKDGKE